MSTLIMIRSDAEDGFNSPAKEKAANRRNRSPLLSPRRAKQFVGASKIKLLFAFCAFSIAFSITSRLSSFMGWNPHHASSVSSPSRGGYTVLINTWKQNSVLKQAIAHYASCHGADAIHVAWSQSELPSEILKIDLHKIVILKSQKANKPNFRFNINANDGSNSRFKPIKYLRTDAIFSVDDDVIVPCPTLDFAFTVWQSAPSTMVGFVPRMHWLDKKQSNVAHYRYGGWWSVWWMGTYSMVLSKAAFFHRKYLDLYTYEMSPSIHNYISRERNCEDIAMSLVVANATVAPPIWVKGKIHEIGASGISNLRGNNHNRNKCLNDLISLCGTLPLVSTSVKAVSSRNEWLW